MKIVAVFIVISTVLVGLHSLAEPDLPKVNQNEDYQNDDQNNPAEDRSQNFATLGVNANANRPLMRPPPGPVPLQLIECYACTDCPKILANTTSKLCPYSQDPLKLNKCVVYAEKYKHLSKPWYIRGCASERGSCSEIRKAHEAHKSIVTLVNCYQCEGDRCNSASHSLIDITMAFFAMVVTPLVAKYTLA